METYSQSALASLKNDICKGDKEGIRVLTHIFFDEIWANMMAGEMDEQADALINLETDLQNDSADFCNSKEPVEMYLRKKWKEKLADLRRKPVSFDGAFMGVQKEELPPPEKVSTHLSLSLQYQYFLSSLSPVERVLFEVKYFQELNGRNGLFQVTHFLLNATSIGYPELASLLKKQDDLNEPLIASFLIRQAKNVFTTKDFQKQETLHDLLSNLPANRAFLKKAFHSLDMKLSRSHNSFKERLENIRALNELEKSFVLINEYLEVEDYFDLWIRINVDAQQYPLLKRELEARGLWNERIKKKHLRLGRKAIMKTLKPGKGNLEENENQIRALHDQINAKLENTISWKTN